MAGTTPNHDVYQSMPADSGLRCPKCEYNLTGVTENRCPECGTTFDPARLQAILAGAPAPIPIWDDPSIHVAVRFIRVCLLTWFAPHKLSRSFPRRYNFRSARRFRWSVLAVAAVIWIVPVALSLDVSVLRLFVITSAGCVSAIVACEAALTAAVEAYLWPAETRPSTLTNATASESYSGLVGMFRSFVLLETLLSLCLTIESTLLLWPRPVVPILLVAVGLWWWGALAIAIVAQSGSSGGKAAVITIVPVAVAISLLFGCAVGFLCFVVVTLVSNILGLS